MRKVRPFSLFILLTLVGGLSHQVAVSHELNSGCFGLLVPLEGRPSLARDMNPDEFKAYLLEELTPLQELNLRNSDSARIRDLVQRGHYQSLIWFLSENGHTEIADRLIDVIEDTLAFGEPVNGTFEGPYYTGYFSGGEFLGGQSGARKVKFKNGIKAVLKKKGPLGRPEQEVLAYQFDRLVRFHGVPVTTARSGVSMTSGLYAYSLQLFLEEDHRAVISPDAPDHIRAFAFLIGKRDLSDNTLYLTDSDRFVSIDNAGSFSVYFSEYQEKTPLVVEGEWLENAFSLTAEEISSSIYGITEGQVKALMRNIQTLRENYDR